MAISPDGSKLYPLLEGALWDGEQFENVDGKRYLRVLEFDAKQQAGLVAAGSTCWKTTRTPSATSI